VIGYWCVNVVIRVLGYLACGGVTAWFAQQGALIEDIERMRRREEGGDFDEDELDSTEVNANTMMPEAYRNVDSSAYSMGIEFDEGMDDDFGDDAPTISSITGMNGRNASASSGENDSRYASTGTGTGTGTTFRSDGGGNVKSFCKSAIGISFGSIVHCAIAGGVANIAWDFLRTVEWIASLSSRFAPLRPGNFRGMTVGGDFSDGNLRDRLIAKWQRLISASRAFVRNRNDLALCHVAAYYKGYTRAANDVMTVIDVSGIEQIIYEDISAHMCSSISKSISGIIVIFIGQSFPTADNDHMIICEIMVTSFIMCYTLIYTMMEPLQASIKALYICFAQNHVTLSQAFPIVYRRLQRMTNERESNMI